MNPKGFTLRMIHRDSKESPFYNPLDNLMAPDERFQSLIDQSRARARYIASQITLAMNPDVLVPVGYDEGTFYYAASLGIGTFPNEQDGYMNYYLLIDSGSDLTWLQCRGATQFFDQDSPLYPWEESESYQPFPCQSHTGPSCNSCNAKGECAYKNYYASSQVSSGVVAKEKFTVKSRSSGIETFTGIMGCGFFQANFTIGNNHSKQKPDFIAGILGLGSGPNSLISNLGPLGQGKFSYCFVKNSSDGFVGNTFLSFGADATIEGQVGRTPLVETSFETSYYYLNLEGISVGGNRLPIPRREFEIDNRDGTGGCIIDSGVPLTTMYKNIFDVVAENLETYFQQYGMRRAGFTGSLACFIPLAGQEYINPTIIFHFQQADYVISETWFERQGNVCLAMASSDSNKPAVVFGAFQQVNKMILYDSMDMSLSFVDENCGRGG
ncbi:aspartic proteinase nepenthesin-2-like [Papaver somniferum]|uniref:aspartic proteinase nepenthesin-2-like n=1 Tax=Papaver somniferum TaxID=3469 RepID=UPI000E700231|nr:aspartic proteinase nepenthesin-2-like [Papaver somniferum]